MGVFITPEGLFSRPKKKKAQIQAFAIFIITIISIAITLLVAKLVFTKIDTAISESGIATNESLAVFDQMEVSFQIFDLGMIFIIIGLTIGLLITSFLIPTHPVFMVINIIGLIFLAFMAAIMANLYGEIIDEQEIQDSLNFSDGTQAFERTSFIMSKFPWICVVIIAITTIVMYAKGTLQ